MTIEQTARAFVQGTPAKCHNAHTDGQVYTLHKSPIAKKEGDVIIFYWHRFYTKTTAAHMNAILRLLNAPRVSHAFARDNNIDTFVERARVYQ